MMLRGALVLLLAAVAAAGLIGGRTHAFRVDDSTLVASHALFADAPPVAGNTFSAKTLTTPTGLAAVPSGHTVLTSWNAANGDGFKLNGGSSGTDSACSAVTYGRLANTVPASFADSRFTPEGTYFCYTIQST